MDWLKKQYGRIKIKLKTNLPVLLVAVLILLFFVFYLYNNIVYSVQSGEGGVLYRRFVGGTVVDKVYPEGIHFIFPWDKMYIYNIRIQQVPYELEVLTKNGMLVSLSLSIRYYPERDLLGVLHKVVGPQYVQTVIIPEIEHVLRVIIGQMSAEDVYTTKRSIIENYLNEAIEKVHRRFISVDNVIIKKITLPAYVGKAIQKKIEQKHLALAHQFKIERQQREKVRKRIEGEGMRDYNTIVNSSLSPEILQWMAIQATLELAKSDNTKVVVVGSGKQGLPVFGNLILDAPGSFSFLPDEKKALIPNGEKNPADSIDTMDKADTIQTNEKKEDASEKTGEEGIPGKTSKFGTSSKIP
ncbi:MAG: prohibitin family protein [Desulfobacterales bacterium]|jgi:regulator of protease activity HflC (stomatin/prohibitin superfamily)|nr:prohibitin family protein [Desulfobacterales bacterium]MDP6808731.1 prohibitin family protein [Desulfobacterales bacterium]|tara:strand:- start:8683 stop:9747 length:1065 start_codon:yes stop_codon:yes gene_type:complete